MDVSVIIPIYNGAMWIDRCIHSICSQSAVGRLNIEICVCNDASSDHTADLLNAWFAKLTKLHINLSVYKNESGSPKGVGFAKNRAVEISTGNYLCFQDIWLFRVLWFCIADLAYLIDHNLFGLFGSTPVLIIFNIDDVMLPNRIMAQYEAARSLDSRHIVGCQFRRYPANSTRRFTKWANSLSPTQLTEQVYTAHGPTVVMPTWFFNRTIFNQIGGFPEDGVGTPEDLIFFYKHLDTGGEIYRVDECLLIYEYHQNATTFSIDEKTIWDIRIKRLQDQILVKWKNFTIWNAGKQGRRLYKSLSEINRQKVIAFCDVDPNKIGKNYQPFNTIERKVERVIPIIHFTEAVVPFIICVKMDLTEGRFEENLESLRLMETQDYVLFS